MRRIKGLACWLLLSFFGCSLPVDLSPQKEVFLQLHVDNTQEAVVSEPRFGSLVVRDSFGDSFVNSHRILFSANPLEMGFYQFASWVEPPTRQFTSLLIDRIEASKLFRSVARLGGSTIGEYQLNPEIIEFYHDTDGAPGFAIVKIRLDFIDSKRREVAARRLFEQKIALEEYSSRGAVVAFSKAIENIMPEIIEWLKQQNPSAL